MKSRKQRKWEQESYLLIVHSLKVEAVSSVYVNRPVLFLPSFSGNRVLRGEGGTSEMVQRVATEAYRLSVLHDVSIQRMNVSVSGTKYLMPPAPTPFFPLSPPSISSLSFHLTPFSLSLPSFLFPPTPIPPSSCRSVPQVTTSLFGCRPQTRAATTEMHSGPQKMMLWQR